MAPFVSWALVGRQDELSRITQERAAGAPGVVIAAPSGAGKTRLARAAFAAALEAGAYGAWVQATRSSAEIPGAAFAHLIAGEGQAPQGLALFRAMAATLRAGADGRDIVVAIDDAHLLDSVSAGLLLHLVEHVEVFAIATVQSGSRCPDALTALWKDLGAARLELRELGDPELRDMVESALGGAVSHDVLRWLIRTSGGNLLYIHHLLSGALESGALLDDGSWRLAREPPSAPSLRELIAARMGSLADAERDGLELVTLGEPLLFAEASALIGVPVLAHLEQRRLVVMQEGEDGAVVRLGHPLYGELIATEMPISRGNAHRIKLAGLLRQRASRSAADAIRLARWLIEAGEQVPVEILLEAATAAQRAGSELTTPLARLALEAGARADAALILAAAHAVHAQPLEAEAVLREHEHAFAGHPRALEYLRRRVTNLQWGLGRTEEALELLERASAWREDDTWRGEVEMVRLQLVALARPGTATDALIAALADEELPADARRWLSLALATDRFWAGQVREGETMLVGWPSLPLEREIDFIEFATCAAVGLASGQRLPALEGDMRQAFERAADAADPAAAGFAAVTVSATSYLAGRLLDARRWLNEGVAQASRQDPFSTTQLACSLQVGVALALGDHAAAGRAGERLRTELERTRVPTRPVLPWIARGRAWAQLAAGDSHEAQRILIAAADEHSAAPVYDAELRYEAMRAGMPARRLADALADLATRCDAPLTAAYAEHIAARAVGDPEGMLTASESFSALGATLSGAEAAAHAAAAFAAEGREDSARRAAARSRELAPPDQGILPFAIDGVDRAATELTPREAQMVELAARGLTNAEIAVRLVVSRRTVETHIYRAMRKLGVSDRRHFPTERAGAGGPGRRER